MAVTGVVMAAGFGRRLQNVVREPKPLAAVAGAPLLCHILGRLAGLPLDRVCLVVRESDVAFLRYRPWFEQCAGIPLEVVCLSRESYVGSPLSDLASLGRRGYFREDEILLVSYCDIVTTFGLGALLDLHQKRTAAGMVTMLLFDSDKDLFDHKYRLEPTGRVLIRPEPSAERGLLAFGGVFVAAGGLLARYDPTREIQFSRDGGPAVRADALGILFGCAVGEDYCHEVGSPRTFENCSSDVTSDPALRKRLFPFLLT